MIDDINWTFQLRKNILNPNHMEIHWKAMATRDKDYCQSKGLLPKLKSFVTYVEASYEAFRSR